MAVNGRNPLSYLGVNTETPVLVVTNSRDPGTRDNKFNIGTIWVNRPDEKIWLLSDLSEGIATWFQMGGSDAGAINFVTDSGTAVVDGQTINILGDASPASTEGHHDIVEQMFENGLDGQLVISGGSEPTWATVSSSDNTVVITGGANTLDLTLAPGLTQVNADSGFAQPSGGDLNMLGDSNVISTSGSSNNVTTTLDNGTNGQLLIGGGSAATYATLTSTGGTVTITNGANTINLEVPAPVPTSFVTDSGTATPSAGVLNVEGLGNDVNTSSTGDEYLYVGLGNYEGIVSFTPSLTFGTTTPTGLTYATRFGYYARAGNALYMNLYIQLSSKGSGGAGYVNVVGPNIPFYNVTTFNLRLSNITVTSGTNGFNCFGVGSGLALRITEPAAGGNTYLNWSELTNSSVIHMSGVLI